MHFILQILQKNNQVLTLEKKKLKSACHCANIKWNICLHRITGWRRILKTSQSSNSTQSRTKKCMLLRALSSPVLNIQRWRLHKFSRQPLLDFRQCKKALIYVLHFLFLGSLYQVRFMRKIIQKTCMLKRNSQELTDRKARQYLQARFTGTGLEITDFLKKKMSNWWGGADYKSICTCPLHLEAQVFACRFHIT